MKQNKLWAILALSLLSTPLYASDMVVSRPHSGMGSDFYLGFGLGNGSYSEADESAVTYGLFGGYHLNEVLGLELGWTNLGDIESGAQSSSASAAHLALLGKLGLRTNLTLLAKLGLTSWSYDFEDKDASVNESDSGNNVFYGVGADYDITGSSTVRFMFENFILEPTIQNNKESEDVQNISVSFMFRF